QTFQGSNGSDAPVNKSRNRVGNASAANDKRGQAHKGQKIGQAVDKIFSPLGGPVPRLQLPASIGKLLLCFHDEIAGHLEALIIFKSHTVAIGDKAPGLDEARCFQSVGAHEKARTQNESIGNSVWLV